MERFSENCSWTVTDINNNEKLRIKEKNSVVYKNGESAPFDGFSYIQLKTTNGKDVILACLQFKWRTLTAQPQKITVNMIHKEYESTKKALTNKLNLQKDDFIFVLLYICPLNDDIDGSTDLFKGIENAALICKNNFCTLYGFTYATRAQFAAGKLENFLFFFFLTFPSNTVNA